MVIVLIKMYHIDDALITIDKAIEIDPRNPEAWYLKGMVLGTLGRYTDALPAFDKVIGLESNNEKAWHNKGASLLNLGRFEEALPLLRRR